MKLYSSGNFVWAKNMGGNSGSGIGNSMSFDAGGNVYTTGVFSGIVDFDPGSGSYNLSSNGIYDNFISKLDNFGNFVWAKSMGGNYNDFSRSLTIDASGISYTTGWFRDTVDFDPGGGTYNLRDCYEITCTFLLVLLLANCVKNTRRSVAMPAFFALFANKITAYILFTLFRNRP